MKHLLWIVPLILLVIFGSYKLYSGKMRSGALGEERAAGEPAGAALPAEIIANRTEQIQNSAPLENRADQILFGDLHVHSTYSTDAFMWSLPIYHGKGVHPVADACDYARYCSAIDFWSITDHAESSTPTRWKRTKESVRQCQAKAGDRNNPDLISLLGFEWTQVGATPSEHFGHKNVIFKHIDDDQVAARPIASTGVAVSALRESDLSLPPALALSDWKNRQIYYDFSRFLANIREVPQCDPNITSKDLPDNCFESAAFPEDLLERLENQNLESLVIPHGSSWGFYTPPDTSWDKQLKPRHRPQDFSLIELYSGHGNSEEFRDYQNVIEIKPDELYECAPIQHNYLPPCQRAGQIILQRCQDAGEEASFCEEQAQKARHAAANMSVPFHVAVNGETPEDWLEAGQCTDCYQPSFNHRPKTSVQYGLAISHFDEEGNIEGEGRRPGRFTWGFIASSDNHRARAGTGYKEVDRRRNTEARGPISERYNIPDELDSGKQDLEVNHLSHTQIATDMGFHLTEMERQASFWLTGGLAAVHTKGRSREEIWDALKRRETYATSGPRVLLWFDRIDLNGEKVPMGAQIEDWRSGTFTVRAVGSFKQKPGCPKHAVNALGETRIADLCSGECYHPTDERNLIERIEIIRIRPQTSPDENVADLIDDPFLTHECVPDALGCSFTFSDPEFANNQRDTLYYARAIQEARPTINAEPIKCERDSDGKCVKAEICHGDYRSGDDECLSMDEVRAWSSPIFVNYVPALPPVEAPGEVLPTEELFDNSIGRDG